MTEHTHRSTSYRRAGVGAWLSVYLLAAMLSLSGARADSILGGADWDTGGLNWTNTYGWTTVSQETSGGNPDGWLSINFPTRPVECEPDQWYDVARTSATNLFAGTWDTTMWVEFDFWASNVLPVAVQVQWQAAGSDSIWGHVVTPPAELGTWTAASASFANWEDWQYPGATLDQYLTDLSAIEWIGVYVFANTDVAQSYGLDQFDLMVPEPSQLLFVAAALSALMLQRRRKP